MAFGHGPRSCPGKQVALNIIEQLNTVWLFPLLAPMEENKAENNTENKNRSDSGKCVIVDLAQNHLFSGRHNDNKNDTSYLQQVLLVVRLLYCSIWQHPYFENSLSRQNSTTTNTTNETSSGKFSSDRYSKYGWGTLRLLIVTLLCVMSHSDSWDLIWGRWFVPCLVGSIGAFVNVNLAHPVFNLMLLALCGVAIILDVQYYDAALIVYWFKTLGGDYFAGKLDTLEGKLSGLFACCFAALSLYPFDHVVLSYGRIWLILFLGQIFCNYGDNHYESLTFFRHRYSYELLSMLLFFGFPTMTHMERRVALLDLIVCISYRATNFIIVVENGF